MASIARYCCCKGCTPTANPECANCTDVTPASYTVTLSGLQVCTDCFYSIAADAFVIVNTSTTTTLNASHTLTHISGSCQWSKSFPLGYEFDQYSDGACTSFVGAGSAAMSVSLIKIASDEWRLSVGALGDTLFTATFTGNGAGICSSLPSSTNEIVLADCDDDGTGVYGGAATITCG